MSELAQSQPETDFLVTPSTAVASDFEESTRVGKTNEFSNISTWTTGSESSRALMLSSPVENSSRLAEIVHSEYAKKQATLFYLLKEAKIVGQSLWSLLDIATNEIMQKPRSVSLVNREWIRNFNLLQLNEIDRLSTEETELDGVLVLKSIKSQLIQSVSHLNRLLTRISETRSRVLVTGDLNAGKSTFVNAMLRREVVPEDQQPCTAVFAEVMDAELNNSIEQVHGIKCPQDYNINDHSTFDKYSIGDVRQIIEENKQGYQILKIYCADKRQQSLLHNGVVDISLIDSPGLNIDNMKTSALFAQQEEIDVVVFVVNAENHFTLSGREFMNLAGKEKEYVFIVVNKFDLIKRKDRCKAEILEQIRQLSPKTWQDANHLVHFVSSKQVLNHDNIVNFSDFARLEDCLRSFILEKREKSKLAPAKLYLNSILGDMNLICEKWIHDSEVEISKLLSDLEYNQPIINNLNRIQEQVFDQEDQLVNTLSSTVESDSTKLLHALQDNFEFYTVALEWPGVFKIFTYADGLRDLLFDMTNLRVKRCETKAKERFDEILQQLKFCLDSNNVHISSLSNTTQISFEADVIQTFDTSFNINLIQDFAPGTFIVCLGSIGYKLTSFAIQKTSFIHGTRNLLAGMIIAGIGMFMYVFHDLRNSIQYQLVSKTRKHLESTLFVENTIERIKRTTRKNLKQIFTEMSGEFRRQMLEATTNSCRAQENLEQMRKRKDGFTEILKRCKQLQSTVQQVE